MTTISHEMQTRRPEHVTCYYQSESMKTAALAELYPSKRVVQLAHVVYDHIQKKFTKERKGNEDLMNALLLVKRNPNLITDEMMELVELHK